jgi:hypothetical protein
MPAITFYSVSLRGVATGQACWLGGLALFGIVGRASAQTLVAVDDLYPVAARQILIVEAPGVLENDSLDGEDLPPTAEAELSSDVQHGVLECPGDPFSSLCSDGSFDYTPDLDFLGDDSFTYRVNDGGNVSDLATVTLSVSGCSGGPQVFVCWVESSYLAKLGELGFSNFQEGFESDVVWGSARGPDSVPSVVSQEIEWRPNNSISQVTTGPGPARTGQWGFWEMPHGDPTGGPFDPLRDGFKGSWTGAGNLVGVGGWLTSNTGGARVAFALDGALTPGFIDPSVRSLRRFFGVIDTTGFIEFEIFETEGVVQDQEFIFGDDFSFGSLPSPDTTPPRVTQVNTVADTGDAVLSEGEITGVPITEFLVTYSELVRNLGGDGDAVSVINPANYLLFSDGGDGFETLDCAGGVALSDEAISVDFVTWVTGSESTATMGVNGGTALPVGTYRLLVCGSTSIQDWSGNALDGDADGIGGDDFVRNFIMTGNSEPVADAGGPYSVVAFSSVTLDGSGSTDSNGTIVSYLWNFGDDSSGTGVNPVHTYTTAGIFSVTLTVTDNDGATDIDTTTIDISCPSDLNLSGMEITGTQAFEAVIKLTAGQVTIASGADVTFVAGETVEIGRQFQVEESANLTVVLDSAADCH